jgi:hypothetical protein
MLTIRKLDSVLNEKDRDVVSDDVCQRKKRATVSIGAKSKEGRKEGSPQFPSAE